MCGKNWSRVCIRYRRRGSPPRVREKLVSGNKRLECYRITPACAGKTNRTPSHLRAVEDHPRVCGKNSKSSNRQSSMAGSPPRVREKLNVVFITNDYHGITPACAGKTIWARNTLRILRDHPRVCGKNLWVSTQPRSLLGSPPRVREKLLKQITLQALDGITPACAGKTEVQMSYHVSYQDHPRVCGKNLSV